MILSRFPGAVLLLDSVGGSDPVDNSAARSSNWADPLLVVILLINLLITLKLITGDAYILL